MSTAETVKAQLQADIAAANAATGKTDATMHDAVASLIEGFGETLPEAAGLSEFPSPAYSVNGADLTAVGEAIGEKTGVEKPVFPDGWKEAVEGIPKTYRTPYSGRLYRAIEDFTATAGSVKNGSTNLYCGAEYLEEATIRGWKTIQGSVNSSPFKNCPKLKKASLPNLNIASSYIIDDCPSLIEASLGSIGYPVSSLYERSLWGTTNNPDLVITVYVDAATLADVPAKVSGGLPGSATDATIVYRNSTTGEVITE